MDEASSRLASIRAEWKAELQSSRLAILAANRDLIIESRRLREGPEDGKCCAGALCLCRHDAMKALNELTSNRRTTAVALLPSSSSPLVLKFPALPRRELLRHCFFPVAPRKQLVRPRSFRRRHGWIEFREPLPRSVAWVQVRSSYRTEDDPVLRFAPYFGEDDIEGGKEVLCHYDASLRQQNITHPCPALATQRRRQAQDLGRRHNLSENEVELLLKGRQGDPLASGAPDRERGLPPPDQSRREEKKVQQKVDDSSHETYLDDVDSYRNLFCRRCFVYDCNMHGNIEAAPPRHVTWQDVRSEKEEDRRKFRLAARAMAVFDGCVVRAGRALQLDPSRLAEAFNVPLPSCCDGVGGGGKEQNDEIREKIPAQLRKKLPRRRHPDRKYETRDIEFGGSTWCSHPGEPCSIKNCPCVQQDTFCSKLCGCFERRPAVTTPQTCLNQFAGCECKSGKCDRRSCYCFAAGRECDPDLCTSCGASQDASDGTRRCSNSQMGSCAPKPRLAVAKSDVPGAGWGLFTPGGASKGQLLAEYVGERLSQQEAERRGRVYDKLNRSYLFNADDQDVVDAARFGNKSRFANHSDRANCVTRAMHVQGLNRIALYAKQDIAPHTELTFDYRYMVAAKGKGQTKQAVLVDWMADHKMANVVSKNNGITLVDDDSCKENGKQSGLKGGAGHLKKRRKT